jgi:hypothetical protein
VELRAIGCAAQPEGLVLRDRTGCKVRGTGRQGEGIGMPLKDREGVRRCRQHWIGAACLCPLYLQPAEFRRLAQVIGAAKGPRQNLAAKADAQNTNIAKFLNNLESRIYAQISQNLATAMFASGGTNQGTLNFEGNTIFWSKDGSMINMQVTDTAGNQTSVSIPLGSFQFPSAVVAP